MEMRSSESPTDTGAFGALLRRSRVAAGLTQEALAEKAGLSAQAISALEQGARLAPHRDTVKRLGAALELSAEARARFEMTADAHRRRGPRRGPFPYWRGSDVPTLAASAPLLPHAGQLIGRERDLATIAGLLAGLGIRLLTLTGTGGVGKTHLALQVAAELAPRFADGAYVAELASLADPSLVPQVLARALSIQEEPARDILATLLRALRRCRSLLVLDNCEHLLEACARLVEAILRECPGVQILATSREGLGIVGEVCRQVPPLDRPDPARLLPVVELSEVAAVRLFVDRAKAMSPAFTLHNRNCGAVADICCRLDGLPLAIELAAACVKAMSVHEIAARLHHRFGLLTGGIRAVRPHHQTLRALFDWSYDLLDAPQRRVFSRLAAFAGGFTLDAAEVVAADREDDSAVGSDIGYEAVGAPAAPLFEGDVAGVLARLVEKSLVEAEEEADGTTRYRLLETLRHYASERLRASGDAESTFTRHALHYLSALGSAPFSTEGAVLNRIEREHDNLRAALRWFVKRGDVERALCLGGMLGPFWAASGHFLEGRSQLAVVLALDGAPASHAARARALRWQAAFTFHEGKEAEARSLGEESLAMWRQDGDPRGLAEILDAMGILVRDQGEYEVARGHLEEALHIHRALGDMVGIAVTLDHLGTVAHAAGDLASAMRHYEESIALLRATESCQDLAWSLHNLAGLALDLPDGVLARRALAESLSLRRGGSEHPAVIRALPLLAALAVLEGHAVEAAKLGAAARTLSEAMGVRLPKIERLALERAHDRARATLAEHEYLAAAAEGQTRTVEQVLVDIAQAMERMPRSSSGHAAPDAGSVEQQGCHPPHWDFLPIGSDGTPHTVVV